MDWPLFVGAAYAGYEMVFESADGLFCGVASMNVWWDELVLDLLLGHEAFESGGCYVVELL